MLTKCVGTAALDCNTVARHYNTTINQKLSAYRSSDNEISFCLAILSRQQQYMLVVYCGLQFTLKLNFGEIRELLEISVPASVYTSTPQSTAHSNLRSYANSLYLKHFTICPK